MIPQAGDAPGYPRAHVDSPVARLHSLLRDRYIWACVLGLTFAAIGGVVGYRHVMLLYRSDGWINIKPRVNRIMYKSEESAVMPLFREFVASQAQLMRSPRVIEKAMEDDKWKALGRPLNPGSREQFERSLSVGGERGSHIVRVAYTDSDSSAAQVAVQSVIKAYMKIYGERDTRDETQRLRILNDRKTTLANLVRDLQERIHSIAKEYGSDALEETYAFMLQEKHRLESRLAEKQVELASRGVEIIDQNEAESQVEETTPAELTIEQIADRDGQMRYLLTSKNRLVSELEVLRRQKLGAKHRKVLRVTTALKLVNADIEARAERLNKEGFVFRSGHGAVDATNVARQSIADLREQTQQLQKLYDKAAAETLSLGRKNLQIKRLREEAARYEVQLQEVRNRIEQLNVESAVSGRIEVISEGNKPFSPINGGKRVQLLALGMAGGGAFGVGVILLIGLLDRRLRNSDDAGYSLGNMRLLGILPRLSEDMKAVDQATIAGYAIHHIRTLLQLGNDRSDGHVTAITSPASGTGKTSLALALGLSFAGSDAKTLLIDCDLAGGGLTSRLQAIVRRRVGQILMRQGLITDEQLAEALRRADIAGGRLGETLIAMGVLAEEDLTDALAIQEDTPVGLLDALEGENFDDCITATGTPGLSILPIGGARAYDMSRMSPAAFRRLIEQARKRFDTILLDSGLVPGSVETSIVAPEADQVILVVSRGEQKHQTEKAIAALDWIGARVAGWVFNRAESGDMERSMYSSSVSASVSAAADGRSALVRAPAEKRSERYGPVARAVVDTSFKVEGVDDDRPGS